jgi:hypothetical protein
MKPACNDIGAPCCTLLHPALTQMHPAYSRTAAPTHLHLPAYRYILLTAVTVPCLPHRPCSSTTAA